MNTELSLEFAAPLGFTELQQQSGPQLHCFCSFMALIVFDGSRQLFSAEKL